MGLALGASTRSKDSYIGYWNSCKSEWRRGVIVRSWRV